MKVGVLGGGQLARMLALAGLPLGLRFAFLDPSADACAFPLGDALHGLYDDHDLLCRLANETEVVTYEFENVSAAAIEILSELVPIYPPQTAIAAKKDRLLEKRLFSNLGIPTPSSLPVHSLQELDNAVSQLGFPLVLKTRSQGYDGKGQRVLKGKDDLARAWNDLGAAPLLAEQFVPFSRELSILAVRGRDGETRHYPLSENIHENGILHLSRSRPGDPLEPLAREYVGRLMAKLNYVGVLALELFQEGATLLANEFAPRVHNTGHWTIEGAQTSQFENHLRAILGYHLGDTAARGPVAMVNCIGELPDVSRILEITGAHVHAYGKVPRPGRKLGHITVCAGDEEDLSKKLADVAKMLKCLDRSAPRATQLGA